ncbi:hypothetical protein Tco_0046704 [Tanacetum coccineum]
MDSKSNRESEGSRKGGSILMLMDELVKVGQTMGYNMDGCMKNIEEIIESQGVDGTSMSTTVYPTVSTREHLEQVYRKTSELPDSRGLSINLARVESLGNMSRIKSWDEIVEKLIIVITKRKIENLIDRTRDNKVLHAKIGKNGKRIQGCYKVPIWAKHSPGGGNLKIKGINVAWSGHGFEIKIILALCAGSEERLSMCIKLSQENLTGLFEVNGTLDGSGEFSKLRLEFIDDNSFRSVYSNSMDKSVQSSNIQAEDNFPQDLPMVGVDFISFALDPKANSISCFPYNTPDMLSALLLTLSSVD